MRVREYSGFGHLRLLKKRTVRIESFEDLAAAEKSACYFPNCSAANNIKKASVRSWGSYKPHKKNSFLKRMTQGSSYESVSLFERSPGAPLEMTLTKARAPVHRQDRHFTFYKCRKPAPRASNLLVQGTRYLPGKNRARSWKRATATAKRNYLTVVERRTRNKFFSQQRLDRGQARESK